MYCFTFKNYVWLSVAKNASTAFEAFFTDKGWNKQTLAETEINSNTKINNNLMKNIKEIKGGSYIDESNIDGLDEKKSIHSNGHNAVISIDTLKDSITNNITIPIIDNKVTDNSSIV